MSQREPQSQSLQPPVPAWLRALAVVALGAIAAAAAYAISIGIANFARIGV